jgi:preprotein translocase subunit SecF
VLQALQQGVEGEVVMRRVEFVGPQVGDELAEQGILAVVYALIGIFLYVMMRFQWRFSAGAVVSLVHDVVITMGVLSLLQMEFDLTVVAAVLALIGYSLNDTIVVFDRIRENFPRMRKSTPVEVIDTSINQTLARTIMTGLTTLLVLVALYIFGGEIIHAFAFTLIFGIIIGTYSSIWVASAISLELGVSKFDLVQVEKEGAATPDSMP